MKTITKIALAAAVAFASTAGAFAQEFTNGTVKKFGVLKRRYRDIPATHSDDNDILQLCKLHEKLMTVR